MKTDLDPDFLVYPKPGLTHVGWLAFKAIKCDQCGKTYPENGGHYCKTQYRWVA